MPFSFPASPTTGQQSTQNGRTYSWSGSAWELVAASGGSGLSWSSVPASPTANGTAGQIAYDNANGFFYVATNTDTWKRAALATWSLFTPASVTGLQLWLDASSADTLYDATTGGSLVAADGGVARWEDKSGNGRHATQATSGNRPLRKTAQQGGKDTLLWGGNLDISLAVPSSTATFKFLHSENNTVFVVAKAGFTENLNNTAFLLDNTARSSANVGYHIMYEDRSGVGNDQMDVHVMRGVNGNYTAKAGANNIFVSNTYSVFSIVCDPSNGTASNRLAIRRNGGTPVGGNTYTSAVSTANATYDLCIGNIASTRTGDGFLGNIAEIIIYSAGLSGTDRAAVEAYLMTKWGIA